MNKRIYLLTSTFLLMLVASIFLFMDFDEHRDLDKIKKKKTLRVVIYSNPINDSIYRFHYELVSQFADSMGLKLQATTEHDLQKSIAGLQKGKYDIIVRSILVTNELREQVDFSPPILFDRQMLVQRKDDSTLIRNQLDLAGKTIHVAQNSPFISRIKNLSEEIGDTIHIVEIPLANSSQLFRMVADGEIDYTVYNERLVKLYAMPNLDIETPIGFTQLEAWAMRKDSPELQEAVNQFLDSFLKTQEYIDIYERYYQ